MKQVLFVILIVAAAQAQVSTSQYDNARTGATLNETVLTPQNVNAKQFGKVGVLKVDGVVFAQPLFVPGVEIPGKGKHDVLYVATEHDSVYAFDADHPNDPPLWQTSFLDAKREVTSVPAHDVSCPFIEPEVGITSTPVIDLKTGTLYVLARTMIRHAMASNEYFQHLHALAITTGVEKFGGPKLIAASAPGTGDDSNKEHQIAFNPLRENPRAALVLASGNLFLTWASSCDRGPYHGWIMAYDPQTLEQKAVWNDTPDGNEGGIWESDTGPAADAEGNIYVPTGNGTFSVAKGGKDYGDSVLKVGLKGSTLTVLDYFTPRDQEHMADTDMDLGSAGPVLLPDLLPGLLRDQAGPHRHLLLQPSKDKRIFVLDRDALGKFHANGDAIVQTQPVRGGGYGSMAYWNGHAYYVGEDDALRDFALVNGELKLAAFSSGKFDGGATPTVSANGAKDAVVWVASKKADGGRYRQAVLYAFDAAKIGQPIYSSETNDARDGAGMAARFVIPIVVNGRVYLGTRSEVDIYGLLK
jgi:outer membrane protein assembly factor BamB